MKAVKRLAMVVFVAAALHQQFSAQEPPPGAPPGWCPSGICPHNLGGFTVTCDYFNIFVTVEAEDPWPAEYCESPEIEEGHNAACEFCFGPTSQLYSVWWCEEEPNGYTGFYCTNPF